MLYNKEKCNYGRKMTVQLKYIRLILLTLFSLFGIQGSNDIAGAQELGLDYAQRPLVTSIRIGPHPFYTRILINITEPVSYQVKADFVNKRITLLLPFTEKGLRLRSKSFNDNNLEKYLVQPSREDLEVTFVLKNQNTRFFHSIDTKKSQIILDIKGEDRPILRTRIGKAQRKPGAQTSLAADAESAPLPKTAKLVGYSPKKILEFVSKSKEEKEKNGWEDYQKALKEFQETKYPAASKMFREFCNLTPILD